MHLLEQIALSFEPRVRRKIFWACVGTLASNRATVARRMPRTLPLYLRTLLFLASLVISIGIFPRWIAGCQANGLFSGDIDAQAPLARHISQEIMAHKGGVFYKSGEERFDGQSAVAIYQMALLGLGQTILEHPEKRDEYLPAMEKAADQLVDPNTLKYAARVYGAHASVRIGPGGGHAYVGYINMGLGMLRLIKKDTIHAALHDRISADLRRELFASPTGMIETYPGESWPPDVAVVVGSIGLHARATGLDIRADLNTWAERFEKCALHPPSGYLYQRVKTGSCKPVDAPRGSGTAIGSYAIGFAHENLARKLYDALARHGYITVAGFGGILEYAPGFSGKGDGNAGPIILGASVGASGFGLGAARMHGDRDGFTYLYRSAAFAGIPMSRGDEARYGAGGMLGDALLFAMLTARRP